MKVTSALLTSMSGSIGGATASRARGDVQYFRKRITPSNPRTPLQTAIRAAVASAAAYWKNTLADADREAWWDEATGGQTGQGIFARINQPRVYGLNSMRVRDINGDIGAGVFTYVTVPPVSVSTDAPGIDNIGIDDSTNTLIVNMTPGDQPWQADRAVGKPALMYIYASHQQSASRFSRQHPYQLLGCVQLLSTDDPADFNPVIDLAALGFTTQTGKVMYVKLITQHALGGISVPSEQRVTIVA